MVQLHVCENPGRSRAGLMWLLALVWLLTVGSVGCSSSKATRGVNPFEVADEEDNADLLDEPVEGKRRSYGARPNADNSVFVLPEPPAQMKKSIDGGIDDWDQREARAFDDSAQLVSGSQFWSGRDDASFRVSIDADAGRVYFWIDVRDDQVIDAESADVMADGVIIWLRDPKLHDVVESLPDAMAEKQRVRPEIAVLFTPDGQFWRHDDTGGSLNRAGIDAVTKKMKNGYRLEVAMSLAVLEQVASLPTEDIAFRVELMDGDEPDRRGEQTRLSMLPDETGPRFALYNIGGWLPYDEARGRPPRAGALGRWQLDEGVWSFDSFEVVSSHWSVMPDAAAFEQVLADSKVLAELCPTAKNERELVEAYQSRSGRHRAGLVVCGQRAPGGRCPASAETHLYWLHLREEGGAWQLASHTEVTDKPLPQCATTARPDQSHYSEFSVLPLGMLGASVWGIGWVERFEGHSQEHEKRGVWFVNPRSKKPLLGQSQTAFVHANRDARTRSASQVYLAPVDDEKGLDLCEVERIEEQRCRGLNKGCRGSEHGKTRRTHIKMWVPEKGRFEPYLLTKHKRCKVSFDFSKRKSFMLLHEGDRLGVLASPAN